MQREHGKKLWQLITKKRDLPFDVLVICDSGDRRALSMAQAICDVLRLPRTIIHMPSNSEANHQGSPSNQHVFDMTKSCRAMVV